MTTLDFLRSALSRASDPARAPVRDLMATRVQRTGPPARGSDHGAWALRAPLGARSPSMRRDPAMYDFLPALGAGLHQIPVGPVHAGIIEPGHFRFNVNGEIVARLEERLGYVHKASMGFSPAPISNAPRRSSHGSPAIPPCLQLCLCPRS